MESIRTGKNDGHLNASPVAEPTDRKMPNPPSVLKVPSPRNPKFRASPEITSDPIRTVAPIEVKRTRKSVADAPVSSWALTAVSVANWPRWIVSVSTVSWKLSILPPEKVSWARSASVFWDPSALTSSAVLRSVTDAENALPGKRVAPPVAM